MTETTYSIRPATPDDAQAIAQAILWGIGSEITENFAGSPERVPLVKQMFANLAAMEHTQYSYLNTLIAQAADGSVAGVLVAYDGARLYDLRHAFANEAHKVLGLEVDFAAMGDETSDDEVYLDTLAVFPEHRRQGLARKLILATIERHKHLGKPTGLLCDPPNVNAHRLYEAIGFRTINQRPFAGVMMDHMVIY
ncbi:MAG: GNAT family N-acetyltransferase [Muribaculaceae bacterium]